LDVGQIAIYRKAFQGAKTADERAKLREAAKLAEESFFEELFPLEETKP
jgi:hypothetical protein